MKLERTVQLEPFQPMTFTSSEHMTARECAEDLVAQMRPLSGFYPALAKPIETLKAAYGV